MIKLSTIIAEDSQENIDTLKFMLEKYNPQVEIKAIAKTLDEADCFFREQNYDLAFLDIQFKKGNIFSVLDKLVVEDIDLPEIVFVTAHGSFEYATKAIQFACLDFVNKPIDADQLDQIIKAVLKKRKSKEDQKKQLEFLLDLLSGDMNAPESLAVVKPKGIIKYIQLKDLLFIQADKSTSIFQTIGEKIYSTRHMGYYTDLLTGNSNIVQINRSCLVNMDLIQTYNPKTRIIKLQDGIELSVSHRYNKKFKHMVDRLQKRPIEDALRKIKDLFS